MIKCPICGQENPDNASNCSKCSINLKSALENTEKMQAQWDDERERYQFSPEEYLLRKSRKLIQGIFIATTPAIQGRTISKYLGIASSAFVLGTGIFSEIDASLSDLLGIQASKYQDKLHLAREYVIDDMKEQVYKSGGDGIIGIEFDYMTIGHDMIMVSGSGTIVKFETKTTAPEEQL